MFMCCCSHGGDERSSLAEPDILEEATLVHTEPVIVLKTLEAPASDLPNTGEPLTAKVTLKRKSPAESWGLRYESVGGSGHLLLNQVGPGAAEDFNREAAPGEYQFRTYDLLTSVNGKAHKEEMVRILNSDESNSLEVEISRPRTITEPLCKHNGTLGVKFHRSEAGRSLTVSGISDTSLAKKNGANIQTGDVIVASDGKLGMGKDLIEYLKCSKAPVVTMLRFAEDPTKAEV